MGEVHVSDISIKLVQSQKSPQIQKRHFCALRFRQLSFSEQNYNVENHELMAMIQRLQTWRHWLEGSVVPFIIWIDYKNLTNLKMSPISDSS